MEKADMNKTAPANTKTRRLVLTSILFAASIVLAVIENMLPPIPAPVPGVKMGLSNIAVMYALFFIGPAQAYGIAALKSLFVVITRGLIAGVLSLSGGILSISVMLLVLFVSKRKSSYAMTSMAGAISHNIGQFLVITIIYTGTNIWFYLPVLVIAGLISGLLTAGLLRILLPAVKKLV